MSCPATINLRFEEAARHLLGRWPATVPDTALRADYDYLLAQAQAHEGCRFWLLDMRARSWNSLAIRDWFGHRFAPQLHMALRRPVFLAYVLAPFHSAQLTDASMQAMQVACAAHDVYPFFFDNEADARAWLAHQQALG